MSTAVLVALVVLGLATAGGLLAWWSGGPSGRPLDPASPVRVLVVVLTATEAVGSAALALDGRVGGPLLVGAALVALGVGAWLGAWRWGRPRAIPETIAAGPVRWAVVGAGVVLGLVALGTIVARAGLPLLSPDPQASRAAFSGLTLDAFRWLVPPAALLALGWALALPSRLRLALAALALAGVAGLEVLFASRALPLELGLGAALLVWWSGHRPRPRVWLALGIGAMALFLGVLFARMGPAASFKDPADALQFVADRTIGRVVLIQARTIDVAVTAVPEDEPYWGGATYVHRVGPLLGIEDSHPPLGTWLYERLYPGAEPAFAAPGILAEGWVNAGPPLALALMLLLGLVSQAFGRALGRLGAGPADRAAAAAVTIAIARTYATSLNGLLVTLAAITLWWLLIRPGSLGLARRAVTGYGHADVSRATSDPA